MCWTIRAAGEDDIGALLALWDLARVEPGHTVAPEYRRRGLAGHLLTAAEARLADLGAVRMQAIVVGSDNRATGFWRASHWHEQTDRIRFTNT